MGTELATKSYVELLQELQEVIAASPFAGGIKLLLAPEGLTVRDDEVLVQSVSADGRSLRVEPHRVETLADDAVLHDSQLLRVVDYDSESNRPTCLIRYPDGPNRPRHIHN